MDKIAGTGDVSSSGTSASTDAIATDTSASSNALSSSSDKAAVVPKVPKVGDKNGRRKR